MYRLMWHRELRLLEMAWCGGSEDMSSEDYRETMEVLTDVAIAHAVNLMLIDTRQVSHKPSVEVLDWCRRLLERRLPRGGTQKVAWVGSKLTGNGSPAIQYVERRFSDDEPALEWLIAPNDGQ